MPESSLSERYEKRVEGKVACLARQKTRQESVAALKQQP